MFFNSAMILLLLRDGQVVTWGELCHHFGCNPNSVDSLTIALEHELSRLIAVGLVKAIPSNGDDQTMRTDLQLQITAPVAALSSVLGLSLRTLASSRPEERMVVVPSLGPPDPELSSADIFVAMPFTDVLTPVYRDHIAPIGRSLGLTVVRADDLFAARQVITVIWSAIANCSLVIADCTGRNPNVFYEIGLAHAVGKIVVLLTQNEDDIPFDLRHLRYIRYAYTPPGMKRFESELGSVLASHFKPNGNASVKDGDRPRRHANRFTGLQEAIAASRSKRIKDTLRTLLDDPAASTEQRVTALVGLLLNKELADIHSAETIIDQGADSIDMLGLVASVESAFDLKLPRSLAHSLILLTPRDLAAQLDLLAAGPAA